MDMASPVKAGGATHMEIIDALMATCHPSPDLQEALDDKPYEMFETRKRAVRLIEADRMRPKYARLGTRRIARILDVSERALYEWWDAYEEKGIPGLRNNMEGRGRPPKVDRKEIEAAKNRLERNAQAEAAKRNAEAAKKAEEAKKAKDAEGGEAARRPRMPRAARRPRMPRAAAAAPWL